MKKMFTVILIVISTAFVHAEESSCPYHEEHMKQMQDLNKRGDQHMGFDQNKTTHHFTLSPEGGTIEVVVKDPSDDKSLESVRKHLNEIAALFSQGDFAIPEAVHDRIPPGVHEMTRLKDTIDYRYEKIDLGGRVRITTKNEDAIEAIHEFLKFQIQDHHTGDPLQTP